MFPSHDQVGREYGGTQEGAAFGTIENGINNNMNTLDYLDEKFGEGFTEQYNLR